MARGKEMGLGKCGRSASFGVGFGIGFEGKIWKKWMGNFWKGYSFIGNLMMDNRMGAKLLKICVYVHVS